MIDIRISFQKFLKLEATRGILSKNISTLYYLDHSDCVKVCLTSKLLKTDRLHAQTKFSKYGITLN